MHLTVTLLHCWLIRFELHALLHTFLPLLHKPEHFQCPNFLVETKKQIHTSDTPMITMKSPPPPLVCAPLDSHTPCVGGPWGSRLSLSLFPEKSAMLRLQCGLGTLLRGAFTKITPGLRCVLPGTYLCDRLFVPHGRLFDKTLDFYIPISTRNDHPGPPEAHRHFHFPFFSSAALIPKRKKPRQSDNNHPRRCVGAENTETPSLSTQADSSLCPASSKEKREAQHKIQRQGWVASSLCGVDSLTESSQQKKPPQRERTTGQLTTDTACAPTCQSRHEECSQRGLIHLSSLYISLRFYHIIHKFEKLNKNLRWQVVISREW